MPRGESEPERMIGPEGTIRANLLRNPSGSIPLKGMEARVGIEPTHKGFADLSLTTWVPRLGRAAVVLTEKRTLQIAQGLTAWFAGAERIGAGDEI